MKQSLSLSLGHNLAMTPALQQAIRLLQLSTLDLSQEIQQALDSNLMLERAEENAEASAETQSTESAPGDIPSELPVDADWTDIYNQGPMPRNPAKEGAWEFRQASMQATPSLADHLLDQIALENLGPSGQAIAEHLVDALNEDGYMTREWDALRDQIAAQTETTAETVESVLARIQALEPAGVAARSLAECLELQLRQLPPNTPGAGTALEIIPEHLHLLADPNLSALCKAAGLDETTVESAHALIRTLQPRPGAPFYNQRTQYIKPEIYVEKKHGRWQVSLNRDIIPHIRINSYYQSLIRRGDKSEDQTCIKNHLQEARFFLKSLRSRNETLLRVSQAIVEQQQEFLERGEKAMKPLVLKDVAEMVDAHESTVSRATANKYLQCPRGVFELKYFFSSAVSGSGNSPVAIQAMIRQLVDEEPAGKPYSDSKLTQLLLERNIEVARRTVAKYRELQNIPSSSERKSLHTTHRI